MDQPITRGNYVRVGEATYLVVQHDALEALPTIVGLPATPTPLPHRPPLVVRDDINDLWVHTFAPATILRADITVALGNAPDTVTDTAVAALAAVVHAAPLERSVG